MSASILSMEIVEDVVMTASQFAACEAELRLLRQRRTEGLPARLRVAREFVAADAAEEIAQIQQDQVVLDARIRSLEELLRTVTVCAQGHDTDVVTVGCTVELKYPRTGRVVRLPVVGASRLTDTRALSVRSPVGQAVMGCRVGDVVSAELPGGWSETVQILSISQEP